MMYITHPYFVSITPENKGLWPLEGTPYQVGHNSSFYTVAEFKHGTGVVLAFGDVCEVVPVLLKTYSHLKESVQLINSCLNSRNQHEKEWNAYCRDFDHKFLPTQKTGFCTETDLSVTYQMKEDVDITTRESLSLNDYGLMLTDHESELHLNVDVESIPLLCSALLVAYSETA